MNEGIERIKQVHRDADGNVWSGVDGRGAWRFIEAEKRWLAANAIYRHVFAMIGMEISAGDIVKMIDKNDYRASFDGEFGIDVVLRTKSGYRMTVQEKLLSYNQPTVTVEYMQDWRNNVRGDWFQLGCQYYFVGYHDKGSRNLHSWILLNWAEVRRLSDQMRIQWHERKNTKDGARSSFNYAHFRLFPPSCVLAVQYRGGEPTINVHTCQMPQLALQEAQYGNTNQR